MVKPKPDGYSTVSVYLVVPGAAKTITFMEQAFGAKEIRRFNAPDGAIMHAEVRLGDSVVMLGDSGANPPKTASLHLYMDDVDAAYRGALAAGATSLREPADQPDGDRRGGVADEFGNQWWLAQHVKDVPDEAIRSGGASSTA